MQQSFLVGDIVISKAGHDKSKYAMVVSVVNEQFVLIADGKLRTIEKPKLKKIKHLAKVCETQQMQCLTYDKLQNKIITQTIAEITKSI